jgi:predicted component of type VI protein secretion system
LFKEVSEEDYVNEIIQGIKEDKVKTEKEQKRILKEKMKEMRNKLANNIDVLLNDKDLDL